MIATVKLMTDYHHTYVIIFFWGVVWGKQLRSTLFQISDYNISNMHKLLMDLKVCA